MLNYKVTLSEAASSNQWAVLIHGLFGNLDNLNNLARSQFSERHCLQIDLLNHGASPWFDSISYTDITDHIVAVLDHEKIDSAHIVGHSLGGKAAMHLALNQPHRCSSVVAADIAPVPYSDRHQSVFAGLRNVDLTQLTTRQDAIKPLAQYVPEAGVQQFLLKNLKRTEHGWKWDFNLEGLSKSYSELIDWPPIAAQYEKPVLFVIGGESDYVKAEHQSAIREHFPNASAKIINGAGHWLHAEKPTVFNKIVNNFILSIEQN